jgi:hypothetical protein
MTVWRPCISAAKAAVFSDVLLCTDKGAGLEVALRRVLFRSAANAFGSTLRCVSGWCIFGGGFIA